MKEFWRGVTKWTLPEVIEVLTEAHEYFDNKSDVVDGDYGESVPNPEMILASRTQDALEYIEWLRTELREIIK